MGGAGFTQGLLSGMGQEMARAQEQQATDEYKKMLTKQLKGELDMKELQMKNLSAWAADPTNITKAVLAGHKPEDILMMHFLPQMMNGANGGAAGPAAGSPAALPPGQPGRAGGSDVTFPLPYTMPDVSPSLLSGDLTNDFRKSTQLPTDLFTLKDMGPIANAGYALTGGAGQAQGAAPANGFQFDPGKYFRHKWYGETNANPADVTGQFTKFNPETEQNEVYLRTRGASQIYAGLAPREVDWVNVPDPSSPTGVSQQGYTKTGQEIPGLKRPIAVPLHLEQGTDTGGTGATGIIGISPYTARKPGLPASPADVFNRAATTAPGNAPGAQTPGMINVTLDPRTLTSADIDGLTAKLKQQAQQAQGQRQPGASSAGSPSSNLDTVLKPGANDLPIVGEDIAKYVNPRQPNAALPRNATPNQAIGMGFYPVDTDTKKKIQGLATVDAQLGYITRQLGRTFGPVEKIMEEHPSWLDERAGAYGRVLGSTLKLGTSEKVQSLFGYLDASKGPLIRTLGAESGNLSEGDVARASGWMPSKTDSIRVMYQKVNLLKEFKDDVQEAYAKKEYNPASDGSTTVNDKWGRLDQLGYKGPEFYNVNGQKTWIDSGNKYLNLWNQQSGGGR